MTRKPHTPPLEMAPVNGAPKPSFAELATLNAGVVLEPLAANTPIDELDAYVQQGIASLDTPDVIAIIEGHTDAGQERKNLYGRYSTIRKSHQTEPTFAELMALNAGVVLEPLASGKPVGELDGFVLNGLAGLSNGEVKRIVTGYAEGREAHQLMERFREIKLLSQDQNTQVSAPPTIEQPSRSKPAKKETVKETPEELIERLVFADPEKPDFERLTLVIAKRSADPDLPRTIEQKLKEHGIDFDSMPGEPPEDARWLEVLEPMCKGYNKYLFKNPIYQQHGTLKRLLGAWVRKLPEPGGKLATQVKLKIIYAIMDGLVGSYRTPRQLETFNQEVVSLIESLGEGQHADEMNRTSDAKHELARGLIDAQEKAHRKIADKVRRQQRILRVTMATDSPHGHSVTPGLVRFYV